MVMSTVIFCVAYGAFPIFLFVDIIFVDTWEFLPFCYSTTDFLFFFFRECCPHFISGFIVTLAQSCLSLYHSSIGEDLYQLNCSASCLCLAFLLRICALL